MDYLRLKSPTHCSRSVSGAMQALGTTKQSFKYIMSKHFLYIHSIQE